MNIVVAFQDKTKNCFAKKVQNFQYFLQVLEIIIVVCYTLLLAYPLLDLPLRIVDV